MDTASLSFAVIGCNKSRFPGLLLAQRGDLSWLKTETIAVAIEQNLSILSLSSFHRLDPLTPAGAVPHGTEETERAILGIRAVVLAHDRFDGFGGFVGVVKGNGRDVVVQDMSLDDAMEELTANEAEFAVNGGGGATSEVPNVTGIVWEGGIGMLEVGDGH